MENGFGKDFSESYAMKGGDGPHSYAQNSSSGIISIPFSYTLSLIISFI